MFHFHCKVDGEAFTHILKEEGDQPYSCWWGGDYFLNGILDTSFVSLSNTLNLHSVSPFKDVYNTSLVNRSLLFILSANFIVLCFCFVYESPLFYTGGLLFQWCVLTADVTSLQQTPAQLPYCKSMFKHFYNYQRKMEEVRFQSQ